MIENIDICKKCGGRCCKKSGCDYLPSDFSDLSTNGLFQKLNDGNISVVATFYFEKLPNGKIYANPFLYLRARNLNREIIDLFSMKTTCSQLTLNGCKYVYETRPSMGKNLVPVDGNNCYPDKNPIEMISEWNSYQKVLSKLVKRFTGLTVEEKLSQDVLKLFIDVAANNFEGIDELEKLDIKSILPTLMQAYPLELESAIEKTKQKVFIR